MARCTTRSVSRIHITLTDLLGSLGRVDGGAGIALEKPYHLVSAEVSEGILG
jgi:beta-ribofuranosylaminobenzene 5'-phosphate synthase